MHGAQVGGSEFEDVLKVVTPEGIPEWRVRRPALKDVLLCCMCSQQGFGSHACAAVYLWLE